MFWSDHPGYQQRQQQGHDQERLSRYGTRRCKAVHRPSFWIAEPLSRWRATRSSNLRCSLCPPSVSFSKSSAMKSGAPYPTIWRMTSQMKCGGGSRSTYAGAGAAPPSTTACEMSCSYCATREQSSFPRALVSVCTDDFSNSNPVRLTDRPAWVHRPCCDGRRLLEAET
jgi:hypothetical protein